MHSTEQLSAAFAGRYTIQRALGAGGMATVYLAHDQKHDRQVAIKVLKPELAAMLGAERFVVEIKTTASLQHPHILPLFDSGDAAGFLYYVMPYVEGETIRDKLNRESQFGVEEAIRIARELADALDYAHRRGVVHRDIKPENILLHDGRAMLMDFGIALALSAAAGGRMTETGLSLGTPHYMSPEQATAEKEITPRSDVYSLATVLYEMLSGQPPHTGGTAQQVIMKIITEAARPVNQLRRSVPANVAAALDKALEKVPADRFENAKSFGEALASSSFSHVTTAGSTITSSSSAMSSRARFGRRDLIVAGATLAIAALVMTGTALFNRPAEQPTRRFDLDMRTLVPEPLADFAISPDGSMIAVAGTMSGSDGIFLRRLDGDPDFHKIPGTETATSPAFSPDNEWIVFRRVSDRALVKLNVRGGGSMVLVKEGGTLDPRFPHWGLDDRIVFSGPLGIGMVDASGGGLTPLPKVTGRRQFLLPDGSGVLFSDGSTTSLYEFERDTVIALLEGRNPVYLPQGQLLYSSLDGGLFAVPFDLRRHRVTGPPVRVLERVATSLNRRGYVVSANGVVVQHDAVGSIGGGENELVIVDPGRRADTVRLPRGRHLLPRFSPDGGRIAMEVQTNTGDARTDIYTADLVSGAFTQVTFDGDNDEPAWSPDGKTLAYDRLFAPTTAGDRASGGEHIIMKLADNSGPERRLTSTGYNEVTLQQWLTEKTLLFGATTLNSGGDILTISTDSGSAAISYASTPFTESEPRVSPDGKMIVYVSNETGAAQLWMRDFPEPRGKWNLSRSSPRAPRWAPDGKAVFFWRTGAAVDSLFRVRIDRTPTVVVHDAQLVVAINADGLQNWDLHPDGRRFVVAVPASSASVAPKSASPDRYVIIENWFGELRRLTTKR